MTDSEYVKERLVTVIKKYGIITAPEGQDFTLASGAKSKFYIDFSKIMLKPDGMIAVSAALWYNLNKLDYDCIGGPSNGADIILGGYLQYLWVYQNCGFGSLYPDRTVSGFTIRKEPKGRGPGAGDLFEGYLEAGQIAVLVEDVTTSGESVLRALKVVQDRGLTVVKVISLLDRRAGAAERLKDYNFQALTTLADLGL